MFFLLLPFVFVSMYCFKKHWGKRLPYKNTSHYVDSEVRVSAGNLELVTVPRYKHDFTGDNNYMNTTAENNHVFDYEEPCNLNDEFDFEEPCNIYASVQSLNTKL